MRNTAAKTKLKHIDCRQEWARTLRDKDICLPQHVDTELNLADLFTKILSVGVFQRLRQLSKNEGSAGPSETPLVRATPRLRTRIRSAWWVMVNRHAKAHYLRYNNQRTHSGRAHHGAHLSHPPRCHVVSKRVRLLLYAHHGS